MRQRDLDPASRGNAHARLPRERRGTIRSLGEGRRGVLEEREEVRSRKDRARRQRQRREQRKGIGRDANRSGRGGFALAGGDQGHETKMRRAGIGMELFMQSGRGAQHRRRHDREGKERGEKEPA